MQNAVTAFTGFQLEKWTPVPDQLFDELLCVLSGNELKVLLYIIRRTSGFSKVSDTISIRQMLHGIVCKNGKRLDGGVGIKSKTTLLRVLRSLSEKALIARERRSNSRRGNLPTAYSLSVAKDAQVEAHEPEVEKGSTEIDPGLGTSIAPGGGTKVVPSTRYRDTRIQSGTKYLNNVVEKTKKSGKPQVPKKPRDKVDYLISEMETQTGDTHSRGNFAKLAMSLPDSVVFQAMSELKQTQDVQNQGALLTHILQQKMQIKKPVPPQSQRSEQLICSIFGN